MERLSPAGCSEVRVVTRPEKQDVRALARAAGAREVLGHPEHLAASIGLGIDGLPDDAIVLLGFPDSVWLPRDGFLPLLAAVRGGAAAALGLFRVDEPWRSDPVRLDAGGRVTGIDVKPANPATSWIWAILAARAGALRGIERQEWPSEHLADLAQRDVVVAQRLSETYLDVGTHAALAGAEGWLAAHVGDA